MAISKPKLSSRKKQSAKPNNKKRSIRSNKPSPGEFALRERTLPGRRFVEFPLVKGKVVVSPWWVLALVVAPLR